MKTAVAILTALCGLATSIAIPVPPEPLVTKPPFLGGHGPALPPTHTPTTSSGLAPSKRLIPLTTETLFPARITASAVVKRGALASTKRPPGLPPVRRQHGGAPARIELLPEPGTISAKRQHGGAPAKIGPPPEQQAGIDGELGARAFRVDPFELSGLTMTTHSLLNTATYSFNIVRSAVSRTAFGCATTVPNTQALTSSAWTDCTVAVNSGTARFRITVIAPGTQAPGSVTLSLVAQSAEPEDVVIVHGDGVFDAAVFVGDGVGFSEYVGGGNVNVTASSSPV